ncbi:MAG TPA: ACP S-malonyltransferase [Blastocatellia bacterium]|nr:ACP S-malonyltransferase [Blastocatellia bacterium]
MAFLADHNIEGQAELLWGTLSAEGWLPFLPMRLLRFVDVGLSFDSTDREIWRFAQERRMLLLTANRNMSGDDSLEQTIREENRADSLPVITISDVDQMMDKTYREQCATRLVEIALYLEDYRGAGRLFIP